jgi:hypothetical protein
MNRLVYIDENGKPVFTGKEEPQRPQMRNETSKIECPLCHAQVDYLLGNVRQGCEGCFDKSLDEPLKGGDEHVKGQELDI